MARVPWTKFSHPELIDGTGTREGQRGHGLGRGVPEAEVFDRDGGPTVTSPLVTSESRDPADYGPPSAVAGVALPNTAAARWRDPTRSRS